MKVRVRVRVRVRNNLEEVRERRRWTVGVDRHLVRARARVRSPCQG